MNAERDLVGKERVKFLYSAHGCVPEIGPRGGRITTRSTATGWVTRWVWTHGAETR
jgi:hypothetical protein